MAGSTRTGIILAAVKVRSQPGQMAANLEHAAPLVEQATAQGAPLVVLPELFSCGYVPNRAVWDCAEPADGPTSRSLAATAGRLGIYLGAGAAETDGTAGVGRKARPRWDGQGPPLIRHGWRKSGGGMVGGAHDD